jgi:SpoVK/Ycf46/Vps4 family AAA+-type ATPase
MGDYRLTEKSADESEVIKELEKITWNRIVQVVMLLEEVRTKLNNKIKEKI